jgi:hypothetical protein
VCKKAPDDGVQKTAKMCRAKTLVKRVLSVVGNTNTSKTDTR